MGRPTKGCQRSHPHENMNEACEVRTELARVTNELSRTKRSLEKILSCKNTIERELRGQGTPEQEVAKMEAFYAKRRGDA